MLQTPYIDPVTREWVFPDGSRIPVIAGGSVMNSDDTSGGDMNIDLDADDDPDRDQPDDDDDDDQDKDTDWNPPTKTEWERLRSALKNERRDRKRDKRGFEERISNITTSGTAAAEVEIEKARIDERDKVEKKWLRRAVRAEAAAQFAGQGATPTNAERLAKMVDLDKVQYDDRDDEFDGLEDEVEEIIAENPEFFRSKDQEKDQDRSPALRRPKIDGASRGQRGGSSPRKMSSAEKLANQALGRQPRRR